MALNRNRPFRGVFCSTSWAEQLLVTLQRPFPVISSFLERVYVDMGAGKGYWLQILSIEKGEDDDSIPIGSF